MHKGGTGRGFRIGQFSFAKEHNTLPVYGVCPFMYLQPQMFGHKLHYTIGKWFGALPEKRITDSHASRFTNQSDA